MILVVDYGMGNLRSVSKALESLGASVRVSGDPRDVAIARKVILPGVGAFPAAMRELSARGLIEPLKAAIASGVPYLGICLGLQLLFDSSEEGGGAKGLGVLPGIVRRFVFPSHLSPDTSRLKVPHMGWNQVFSHQPSPPQADPPVAEAISSQQTTDSRRTRCPLLEGIPEGGFVYFVHSYYAQPQDRSVVALEAEYGERFTAMVWWEHLYATQFHPEKSQALGLRLLENFVRL